MKTPLQLRAERLWPNNPNYQAQWLRMIELLGPNWLGYPQRLPA